MQDRTLLAGTRYLEHRSTVREALELRLSLLREKARSDPYYAPGSDWRQSLHRRSLARDIAGVRRALRDMP